MHFEIFEEDIDEEILERLNKKFEEMNEILAVVFEQFMAAQQQENEETLDEE